MIPHPSTELLLSGHGNTLAGRRAARRELAAVIAATAAEFTAIAGRSEVCRWGRHYQPDQPSWGCANDGSTCICECHDPKENG